MRANTKTVLKSFDYMHCDDFAKYLEEMAAKGWHFKEWGTGLKFEKGAPEYASYAVEVFTKASENDMRPEPHTQEFAEYCEAAGWKFVDAKQKFCIFKKVDANAVELFTPEERVTNAFQAMVSGSAIALMVLYGINALLQWINICSFFEEQIFNSSFLFSFTIWNVMFMGQLFKFLHALLRKHKMLKLIKEGKEIYIGTREKGKLHVSGNSIYVIILVLLLMSYLFMVGKIEIVLMNIFIIAVTLIFAAVIAKVRPESNTNFAIQVAFGIGLVVVIFIGTIAAMSEDKNIQLEKEELPLQITDYRECIGEIEDIDIYHEKNFLGSCDTCYIFSENDSIIYWVYRTESDEILDKIWEEEIDAKFNMNAADYTAEWGAEIAFRNKIGDYYVKYEDVIFILSESEEIILTQDQIDIIRGKLDLR